MYRDGEGEIRISDGNGCDRLNARVDDAGLPSLTFRDANSTERMDLMLFEDGAPGFSMPDREEETRVHLWLHDRETEATVLSPDGKEQRLGQLWKETPAVKACQSGASDTSTT